MKKTENSGGGIELTDNFVYDIEDSLTGKEIDMGLNVMCVDDERNANINLEYDLKQRKGIHSIVTFTSPRLALEHMKNHSVNMAFLDIQMPEMTGIELAVELRKLFADIMIVFLSGEEIDKKEMEKVGAMGRLFKPYMDEELDEILGRAMKKI